MTNAYNIGNAKISIGGNGSWIDLTNGAFFYEAQDETTTEFKTKGNCYYSIFEDDVQTDSIHIEIEPRWYWTKNDISELINTLKGYVDKEEENLVNNFEFKVDLSDLSDELNNITEKEEKPLFILTAPGSISDETAKRLEDYIKPTLEKANIDAEILVLGEGLTANFLYK